jgi:hypothetical protein
MRRLASLAAIAVLVFSFASQDSHALSCSAMEERYYFSCVKGSCVAEFRAVPFQSLGVCARRDRVEPIPADIAAYLGRLIAASQPAVPDGVYSLRFRFHWWRYHGSEAFPAFERNLRHDTYAFQDDRSLAQIPVEEVAARLNRATGRDWIARQPDGASPAAIKERILEGSRDALVKGIARVAGCWTLLLVLLGLLIYSVRVFYVALRMEASKARTKRLVVAIAVQVALVMVPMLASVTAFFFFFLLFFDCAVILLLSPAVLLAWLVEIFWVVRRRLLSRA